MKFQKGVRSSPATEFKKGQHWREPKPFWNYDWLYLEYIEKQRTLEDIAAQFEVGVTAIGYWLDKHGIRGRSTQEARTLKKWGSPGTSNPMFGKTGSKNPNWKGGITAERQAVYASKEWKAAVRIVYNRDGAKCRKCKKPKTRNGLDLHHIVPFEVKEKRTDPDNLVLLCKTCHGWVHSRKNKRKEYRV
ncbi:MAG: HNH endonuclease [Methanoregulaceae archaeon]|jgi:hypothetical protein|nr:HNH endonuclease [Methanoregulaceae archaeon]